MERFWAAAAGIMVTAVLWIIISKQAKEFSLVLSIGACCLALLLMAAYLDPILDLIARLEDLAGLSEEWIGIMLKAVGIGLVVEIGSLICTDAGNTALGKTLQIAGTFAVLWLSVPLMHGFLELIERILGEA